jgi:hypothetical protein
MTKYGGYAVIALAVVIFMYRFDIVIEVFRGTKHIPYHQLLTPIILLIVGIIILRINSRKKKSKNKKDESPDN